MKKVLAIIITVTIVLSCMTTALAAETDKTETSVQTSKIEIGTGTKYSFKQIVEKYPEAAQYIYNQLKNNYSSLISGKINLNQFNLSVEEGNALYYGVVNENTDLYYVRPDSFSYSQNTSHTQLVAIYPQFIFNTEAEINSAKKAMEKRIKQYISGVNQNWSDLYKARYLHDLIAAQVEYPETDDEGKIIGGNLDVYHWAYGALINSKAVCQGYSLAYMLLLDRCGIKATNVTSDDMGHEWNMVEIDGKYHHVDVTWDDPTNDNLGRVCHTYFMLSDDAFSAADNGGHYGWVGDEADDTTYDNLWFKNVDTFIYYDSENEKDYYIKKEARTDYTMLQIGHLTSRDINSGEETKVYTLNNTDDEFGMVWWVYNSRPQFWSGFHSYLSYYDGYLYFNDKDRIYKLAPGETNPEEVLFRDSDYYIYGLKVTFDGNLKYTAKEAPLNRDEIITYDLKSPINRILDSELEIEENDNNFAMFGIEEPEDGYTGLNLLGVQRKSAEENDSLRFISLVSAEALKEAKEYGFVFTSTTKSTSEAKERAAALTIENGHKYDCTGTINQMTGDYGSDDLNETSYKYVTAAINNITNDKALVARFYFIDNDNNVHYASYIDSNNNKWAGCAARLSDLA